MSTAINDLSASAVCLPAVGPGTYSESATGGAVDLIAGDGAGFAVLAVGTLVEDTAVGGSLEESDDGDTWTEVAGAAFPEVTAANAVPVIAFRRTARYVRANLTVDGPDPEADAAILVGQQKKQF